MSTEILRPGNQNGQSFIAPITYQEPRIEWAHQIPERSRYQAYRRGLRQLENMGAPREFIDKYRYQCAQNSFLAFCEIMKGGDLQVSNFHEIIAAAFEDLFDKRYRRLIISCPPRSGKSMMGTFFLAWLLGRDHETEHIVASYGGSLSNKFHKEAVIYMKKKEFKRIFPTWEGFRSGSKYDMVQGGYILPTSVGGILTGFTAGSSNMTSPGIGVMLVDDPLKGSDSVAAIAGLKPWWVEQASTRRTNNYAQVVIATRFHESDLHGVLIEADGIYHHEDNPMGWRWINFEGLCDHPDLDPLERQLGESHWPENPAFSVQMLLSQKAAGEREFNALYQGHPQSQEGQIVKADWIQTVPEELVPELDFVWLGIDTGFEETKQADFSSITVCGISKKEPGNAYVVEIARGKWGFPELLAQVELFASAYKPKAVCIEKAASGHSLIQVLRQRTKLNIVEMRPLRSKTARLEAITPFLSLKRVYFALSEGWTDDFLHELTQFPYVAKKDRVDSFSWAMTYYAIYLDREKVLHGSEHVITALRKSVVQRFDGEEKQLFRADARGIKYPSENSLSHSTDGGRSGRRSSRRGIGYDTLI